MKKEFLYRKVLELFRINNPDAKTELVYSTPFELLVSVVLSAQCTDVRVNKITPALFQAYPDAGTMVKANVEDVYELIKSCSYPNSKAKNLVEAAKTLSERYNGVVPGDLSELLELPGVGRKTANVILSVIYRKPAMAVDTHVFRVSERIGLTTSPKNHFDAEMQLIKYIPEKDIHIAHHWLILHGRYICKARKPLCDNCFLNHLCCYYRRMK